MYVLTEPNGFTLKLTICSGAKDMTCNLGHAFTVGLHLMKEKLDSGYVLCIFTNVAY